MVSNVNDNNNDVQDTTEIMEDGLFKCKLCGVKFDNANSEMYEIVELQLYYPIALIY
jgi:hypothetical protein